MTTKPEVILLTERSTILEDVYKRTKNKVRIFVRNDVVIVQGDEHDDVINAIRMICGFLSLVRSVIIQNCFFFFLFDVTIWGSKKAQDFFREAS